MRVFCSNVDLLENEKLFDKYFQKVDHLRQEKICKFKFRKDKNLSLGAGLLLNYALTEAGVRNREVAISEFGKPYLKNSKSIFFNISHSGNVVICAIAESKVGCDVEKMDRPPFEIARNVFSQEEQDMLFSKTEDERDRFFYRLWTAKESFLKMTGMGFYCPPTGFSLMPGKNFQTIMGHKCSFFEQVWDNEYILQVCTEGFYDMSQVSIENVDLFSN